MNQFEILREMWEENPDVCLSAIRVMMWLLLTGVAIGAALVGSLEFSAKAVVFWSCGLVLLSMFIYRS